MNAEVKYVMGLIVKGAICNILSPLDVVFLHSNKEIPCTSSTAAQQRSAGIPQSSKNIVDFKRTS